MCQRRKARIQNEIGKPLLGGSHSETRWGLEPPPYTYNALGSN